MLVPVSHMGGVSPELFTMGVVVDTDISGESESGEFLIPMASAGTYDYDVIYQDTVIKSVTDYTDKLVTFPDGGGEKTFYIDGQFEGLHVNYAGDRSKILKFLYFGEGFSYAGLNAVFHGCNNLVSIGPGLPSVLQSGFNMFGYCNNLEFVHGIENWDVSGVTSMYGMFNQNSKFNQDISQWDVSSVTSMNIMFQSATAFNQDLSGWCVSFRSTKPLGFDTATHNWTLPKPIWGTCP